MANDVISREDVDAFSAKLEQWANGLGQKDQKILHYVVQSAVAQRKGAELSDAELGRVAGGMTGGSLSSLLGNLHDANFGAMVDPFAHRAGEMVDPFARRTR